MPQKYLKKDDAQKVTKHVDMVVQDLVDDGGYLNPEQANEFLDKLLISPTLLGQIRMVTMTGPTREINKIGFGSRILHGVSTGGKVTFDSAKRAKATTEKITLTTKKSMAVLHLPYDVLEDNIERGNLRNHIVNAMRTRIEVDLEEWMILADTDIDTATDDLLSLADGYLKRSNQNIVNLQNTEISTDALAQMQLTMPDQYLRNKNSMRYIMSNDNELILRTRISARQTSLGDQLLTMSENVPIHGIRSLGCSNMPNTSLLLTNPQNLIMGVERDIMLEVDKDIESQHYIFVITMRVDFQIEEAEAVVKMTNIAPTSLAVPAA